MQEDNGLSGTWRGRRQRGHPVGAEVTKSRDRRGGPKGVIHRSHIIPRKEPLFGGEKMSISS